MCIRDRSHAWAKLPIVNCLGHVRAPFAMKSDKGLSAVMSNKASGESHAIAAIPSTTVIATAPARFFRAATTRVARFSTEVALARRGTYRVLYRINDDPKEVVVLRIEHRRDVYH